MFTTQDIFTIGFLAFMEGILSIDNALVLAMLARNLPPEQRKKALTYGLGGAMLFRFISLGFVNLLLRWTWVKFVGGAYLLFIAGKYFFGPKEQEEEGDNEVKRVFSNFWKAVIVIELTDIAFAVDSILAAVALSNKFWVVFIGGFMGVVMMRFAANAFITLLEKFPKFETTAYLLVALIGAKVILEGLKLPYLDFHSTAHAPFYIFWSLMIAAISYGFVGPQLDAALANPERERA